MIIELLQKFVPAKIKSVIRPYHRIFFPNKIYGYWNITYRCTYKCSYCPFCNVTDYSKIYPQSSEKSPEQWLKILQKLPSMSFLIIGGEPLLYDGLSEIINNLPKQHSIIGLLSNASLPIDKYKKIKKNVCLSISFHREFAKEQEFIEKVFEIKSIMKINSVNIVATPENIPFLEQLHKKLTPKGITIRVEHLVKPGFQYSSKELELLKKYITYDRNLNFKNFYENCFTKRCSAGRNYINIMPNADTYSCVGGMEYINSVHRQNFILDKNVIQKYKLKNLEDPNFVFETKDRICGNPCIYVCDWDYARIKNNSKNF